MERNVRHNYRDYYIVFNDIIKNDIIKNDIIKK